ncbi:MAG TPA: phospho-N-acetylmuramoyl-pentapeptide-transferase [Candidatus Sulfotelmatobacter sp.]|jgi:phospho-N-acetylmuramoyl-pentapeptide-transferase|nr:phospho-N-acetylmuramoyl-pentapeptide-transferase [Candidatus Sulfotelmatobacter sp.]
MLQLLGLMLSSALITTILLVPFIDFLYKIKLRRNKQVTKDMFNQRTPLFDKFNSWKVGTPFGGGLLIILVVVLSTAWSYGIFNVKVNGWEVFVIFFSFISYGVLGFYDDLKKLAAPGQEKFFGLRFRHKFIIQWILAFIIAAVFYWQLHYDFIYIHGVGQLFLGALFIPFAAFVIVGFVNAFNITDGLDGLATGLLIICLLSFLGINSVQSDPMLGIFIAVLIGSTAAFLYFNIYKARLWLGDVGSLSLGAGLAVTGLLTGKAFALMIIGGVFVLEVGSSLIQLLSKKYLGRKLLPAAPLHLYLLKRGWEEPKIVMRAWLVGFLLAVLGVFIALI